MYCRNCNGKLFEEEIFKEDDDIWYMQIGCFKCSKKIYVPLKKWNDLKRKLEKVILKKRENARGKVKNKEALSIA